MTDEIILVAEAIALPGKADELRRELDILIPKALAEPGILVFRLHTDRDNPDHFMLYERFQNQAAIQSHFATQHYAVISQAAARLAVGGKPKITYFNIVAGDDLKTGYGATKSAK